jgi:8-oxo-dGTP pyrophosphatase MutT (NUDIX family)
LEATRINNILYDFPRLRAHLKQRVLKPMPGKKGQLPMKPYIPYLKEAPAPQILKPKEGAVMAIIYKKADIPHLLLMERTTYNGAHSGQISFPGGKLEKGETYLEAAKRECFEEVGIDQQQYEIVGELTDVFVWASNFMVKPFLAIADELENFYPDKKEVEKILEIPLAHFFDSSIKNEKIIKSFAGVKLMAPYYEVESKELWGATAMMISEIEYLLSHD